MIISRISFLMVAEKHSIHLKVLFCRKGVLLFTFQFTRYEQMKIVDESNINQFNWLSSWHRILRSKFVHRHQYPPPSPFLRVHHQSSLIPDLTWPIWFRSLKHNHFRPCQTLEKPIRKVAKIHKNQIEEAKGIWKSNLNFWGKFLWCVKQYTYGSNEIMLCHHVLLKYVERCRLK